MTVSQQIRDLMKDGRERTFGDIARRVPAPADDLRHAVWSLVTGGRLISDRSNDGKKAIYREKRK